MVGLYLWASAVSTTGCESGSAPNQGLELTGNSVRSYLAPALPRSSGPALGTKPHTTREEGTWYARDMVGTHSSSSIFRPLVGAPAHRRCSGPWSAHYRYFSAASVLRPRVGADRRCSSPASVLRSMVGADGRCAGSWSVLQRCVGAPPLVGADGRCCGSWLVLRPSGGAPASRRCRWSVPWLLVGASASRRCRWSVLQPMGSARASCRCRWSVLRLLVGPPAQRRYSGLASVPTQKNRRQAPSTTLYSAQQGSGADWEKLTLFPAAHRWR
jgi:hypothetical protein